MDYALAISTIDTAQNAAELAKVLVTERIVACVNIMPNVTSIFKWEGVLCEESEHIMFMKTAKPNLEKLRARLPELHSYECPELIVVPITDGFPPYLQWLRDSLFA